MTAFEGIIIGVALVALALGFFVGHYHAGSQWKALLAQIGPGMKSDLTAAEAELVALFRKVTKKETPASVPVDATPPAPPTA